MVAILAREPDHRELEARFGQAEQTLCSAISLWETTRALANIRTLSVAAVADEVDRFVTDFAMSHASIGAPEQQWAIIAHNRYGKGRHTANLNMGDCFAYACTKTNNARLLYKGSDFARTDLA